jgi:hypothetical protein
MALVFKKNNNKSFTEAEQFWIREIKTWNKCENYELARFYTDKYMAFLRNAGVLLA